MSVITMEKLTVIAPLEDADAIVRRLMRLRAVSLRKGAEIDGGSADTSLSLPKSSVSEAAERVSRIDATIPVLTRRSKRKKSLFGSQTTVSFEAFRTDGRFDTAWKVVDETNKILAKKEELKRCLEEALSKMRSYEPYLNLDFPLDFEGTETVKYTVGALPGGTRRERVEAALSGLAAGFDVLHTDGAGVYITLIVHRAEEEETLRALAGLGFIKAPLPSEHKSVKRLFDETEREYQRIEEELEKLEARLTVLSDKLGEVEILSDLERTTLLVEESKQKLSASARCVILHGWCPVSAKKKVIGELSGFCVAYDFEAPGEGDDVPILLKNNGFSKNFEWVLGMYAYPKYGTFDPTLVMSLFYFLIFGLMFADVGYGLVLSAVCFAAVRWLHPREGMKRFLLMFGYCGISCILFGVLFGSYFGNFPLAFMENVLGKTAEELPRLSILPAEAANVAVLFDPIQNPMAFLLISLGVGALHLVMGMAVKAFILCREGKPLDALFDIVTYWVLFAGLLMLFISRTVGIWLTVGGVLSIVFTQGRRKKGIAMKIAGGFLGLYDLINYASDLLSYSRILALGLAAGVIGQVVNILATMKGASFIGILLMLVVFTVGHLLNLVINVLGTFVHTSRLQYIEFFNKFYEEGGTPFRPMAPADRYTAELAPSEEKSKKNKKTDPVMGDNEQLQIKFD